MKKLFINLVCPMIFFTCVLAISACGKYDSNKNNQHVCSYISEVFEPTCTKKGYTQHKCDCGNIYITDELDELGHDLECIAEDKYKNQEADCNQKAIYFRSCSRCDFISEDEFEFGELKEHQLGEFLHDAVYGKYRICGACEKIKGELPIISINTISGENIETKDYIDTKISVSSCAEEYVLDEVDAEVKVRGNGTATHPKKPYRIKFNKKQKMLGLNNDLKAKSWVLLAEYVDKSFSRNILAFSLAEALMEVDNYYVSDYKLVEVYINGEYNGVYVLAEQQQVNDGRVDINEPEEDYNGVDIGYFLEFDTYAQDEDFYFSIDYKNSLTTYAGQICGIDKFNPYYTIKSDIYSIEQKEYIAKYMQNLYDVLYETIYNSSNGEYVYKTLDENGNIIEDHTISSKEEAVCKLIDINSLVSTYILNEIVMNVDYGWSSFFMSIDMSENGNKKLTFEAPWDFDWAITGDLSKVNNVFACNVNSDFFTATDCVNPWLMILCNEDWFWDKVEAKYQSFRESNIVQIISENIFDLSEFYEINFQNNFQLWANSLTYQGYNAQEFINCSSQKEASALIINWFERRIEFLDQWWGYTEEN